MDFPTCLIGQVILDLGGQLLLRNTTENIHFKGSI